MPVSTKQVHAFTNKVRAMQQAGLDLSDATRNRVYRIVDTHRANINDAIRRAATEGGKELPAAEVPRVSDIIRRESQEMQKEIHVALRDAQEEAVKQATLKTEALANAADIEGVFFTPSAELMVMAERYAADLVSTISSELMPKVNAVLGQTIGGGYTPFEAMKEIDLLVGIKGASGVSYQAERIVRTEINRVYNVTLDMQIQNLANYLPNPKQLLKQWVSGPYRQGRREDHQSMNDEPPVPYDEPFILPSGAALMFPGDPMAPAEETINCGCSWKLVPESIVEAAT